MKKSLFAVTMQLFALCSGILTFSFSLFYHLEKQPILLTLAITFGTTFYHFAMRLLVGTLVPNHFNYNNPWFRAAKFEQRLYKTLRLKHWKAQLPTYNPRLFSLQDQTMEQIAANMCHAEVVHEIIIVLSFLPLLLSFVWDSFPVFLVTSLVAACIDLLFVMLQRFNRPRVVKAIHLQTRRNAR